jgi:hypothetical protein
MRRDVSMAKKTNPSKSDLVRDVFPVIDALVSFVPDGQDPPQQLQDQLDQRGHARWYPVEGGHRVKMPFQGADPPPGPFEIERGGWDHDHCDNCNANIHVGEEFWKTMDEDFAVFCTSCYGKLPSRWTWPWQRS